MADAATWMLYRAEAAYFRGYLPNPRELEYRIALLWELKCMGLNRKMVASIMLHDTPTVKAVRRAVARYGPKETWLRYEQFIEECD